MGHPTFDLFLANQYMNPCAEIQFGLPVLPYQYYLSHMTSETIQAFILNEIKVRPQYIDQLATALAKFPTYAKYIKLLVMA